jgi:TPR repeat protein
MKLANLYEKGLGGPRDHAMAERLINSTGVLTAEAKAAQDAREREQAAKWAGILLAPGPARPATQADRPDPLACAMMGHGMLATASNCPSGLGWLPTAP